MLPELSPFHYPNPGNSTPAVHLNGRVSERALNEDSLACVCIRQRTLVIKNRYSRVHA